MRLPCLFLIWLAATLDQPTCEKEEKENDRSFASKKEVVLLYKDAEPEVS